ncbi:MAG TPA: Fur family transcriptional regulator [Candidatus Saccharimonadales bacterium]
MEQLEELFRTHNLRLTHARRSVFKALEQASSPLFIHDIISLCVKSDRTSIYRNLEIFRKLGIIEVIPTGWKQRYELSDLFRAHHHHLQCTRCHALIAINTPELEKTIHTLAKSHGYQLTSHHIELHGLCEKCQK